MPKGGACVRYVAAGVLLATLAGRPPWARGEEAAKEPATVQKTEQRLHFQLPPDWPIERRGGITAPIPIEEYLARKFKAIEAQLQALDQRFNSLDVRLRVLEEEVKKQSQSKGLRSSESSSP